MRRGSTGCVCGAVWPTRHSHDMSDRLQRLWLEGQSTNGQASALWTLHKVLERVCAQAPRAFIIDAFCVRTGLVTCLPQCLVRWSMPRVAVMSTVLCSWSWSCQVRSTETRSQFQLQSTASFFVNWCCVIVLTKWPHVRGLTWPRRVYRHGRRMQLISSATAGLSLCCTWCPAPAVHRAGASIIYPFKNL
jgi:hypothetical protein